MGAEPGEVLVVEPAGVLVGEPAEVLVAEPAEVLGAEPAVAHPHKQQRLILSKILAVLSTA